MSYNSSKITCTMVFASYLLSALASGPPTNGPQTPTDHSIY